MQALECVSIEGFLEPQPLLSPTRGLRLRPQTVGLGDDFYGERPGSDDGGAKSRGDGERNRRASEKWRRGMVERCEGVMLVWRAGVERVPRGANFQNRPRTDHDTHSVNHPTR